MKGKAEIHASPVRRFSPARILRRLFGTRSKDDTTQGSRPAHPVHVELQVVGTKLVVGCDIEELPPDVRERVERELKRQIDAMERRIFGAGQPVQTFNLPNPKYSSPAPQKPQQTPKYYGIINTDPMT